MRSAKNSSAENSVGLNWDRDTWIGVIYAAVSCPMRVPRPVSQCPRVPWTLGKKQLSKYLRLPERGTSDLVYGTFQFSWETVHGLETGERRMIRNCMSILQGVNLGHGARTEFYQSICSLYAASYEKYTWCAFYGRLKVIEDSAAKRRLLRNLLIFSYR